MGGGNARPAVRAPDRARLRDRRDRSAARPRRSAAAAIRANPRRRRLRRRCAGYREAARESGCAASPGRGRRPGRRALRASRRSRRGLRDRRPSAAGGSVSDATSSARSTRGPRFSFSTALHNAEKPPPGFPEGGQRRSCRFSAGRPGPDGPGRDAPAYLMRVMMSRAAPAAANGDAQAGGREVEVGAN